MKKFKLLLLSSIVLLLNCGCHQFIISPENTVIETIEKKEEIIIENEEISYVENEYIEISSDSTEPDLTGLNLYNVLPLTKGEICIYTSAECDEDGEFMFDDGQEFYIYAHINDYYYTIFEKEHVQIGTPEVLVYEDFEEGLHIVLTDVRTAKLSMVEYIFSDDTLLQNILIDNSGGNYIGKI